MKMNSAKGITMCELMVVLSILAVMVGYAFFYGINLIRQERVASATRVLLSDLQKARMNAMTQSAKGFGVRFESPTSYVLFEFDDCNDDYTYNANTCMGSREESNVIRRALPESVVLDKTNPFTALSDHVLIFDRFGTPRRPTWAMGAMTIIVKNEAGSGKIECVSVSTNRIREAFWNGTECVEI